MSDLNDQSEVCFDHPSPSLLVSLLNTCGQLNFLLRSQQRGLADLSKVNLNTRLRIVSHAQTSPQIGSEATAGEASPNVRFDPRKHNKALTSSAKISEFKQRCYNQFGFLPFQARSSLANLIGMPI